VQRMGDQLKITARLLDVMTDTALWSDSFLRGSADVFAIQSEIASAVARGVNVQLSPSEEKKLKNTSTASLQSYEEYLRGRASLFRRTPSDLAMAEFHFKTAIQMDPKFTLAYCGLANALSLLAYYARTRPRDPAERAIFAAKKALELDPELAEAHVALALPTYFYTWDFEAAESLYDQAISRNGNLSQAHHWRCANLMALRRTERFLDSIQRAVVLDPLSPVYAADHAWFHHLLGKQRESEPIIEAVLKTHPEFSRGHHLAGEIWLGAGKPEKAMASFRTAVRLTDGKTPLYLGMLGYTQGILKKTADANATLEALLADRPMPPFVTSLVQLGLGQTDAFFASLEQAVDERSPHLCFWPRYTPMFATVRNDPRFATQMARLRPGG